MRHRLLWLSVILLFSFALVPAPATDKAVSDPAAFVRALLAQPEAMDFGRAKLAIDKLIDPSIDVEAALAEIDGTVATLRKMLATRPPAAAATSDEKLAALRAFLYRPGHWNGERPYAYDMRTIGNHDLRVGLLPNYLATRKGNCISMPILVLILGERLGLNLTLSTAPNHVFVRYTNDALQTFNFEATNGGFARDSHYRKDMPITDAAIANGVYMKTLSRRESLAVMGNLVVEHLMATRRHREAIATADVILAAYPAEVSAILTKANGYLHLLEETMVLRDDGFGEVPAALVPYAEELDRTNLALVARAEALGWRPWDYRPPEADAVASDLIGGRMP